MTSKNISKKYNTLKMGLIHIYTGDGKGKTTSSIGLALRAHESGLKVCVIQFMKQKESNEIKAIKKLGIETYCFGNEGFIDKKYPTKGDKILAQQALDLTEEKIKSEFFDLIVLDELNMAIDFNLININDALKIILPRPPRVEIIITGRNAKSELIQIADYVSEIKEIKHPFKEKGIPAREGIEY